MCCFPHKGRNASEETDWMAVILMVLVVLSDSVLFPRTLFECCLSLLDFYWISTHSLSPPIWDTAH